MPPKKPTANKDDKHPELDEFDDEDESFMDDEFDDDTDDEDEADDGQDDAPDDGKW